MKPTEQTREEIDKEKIKRLTILCAEYKAGLLTDLIKQIEKDYKGPEPVNEAFIKKLNPSYLHSKSFIEKNHINMQQIQNKLDKFIAVNALQFQLARGLTDKDKLNNFREELLRRDVLQQPQSKAKLFFKSALAIVLALSPMGALGIATLFHSKRRAFVEKTQKTLNAENLPEKNKPKP